MTLFFPHEDYNKTIPLAHIFFVVCWRFSTLLNEVKEMGWTKGACIGKERLALNHLFFADDCILFGEVLVKGAQNVQKVITKYEEASTQKVNYDKALIYFKTNVNLLDRENMGSMLGAKVSTTLEKYLKLLIMVGRSKKRLLPIFWITLTRRLIDGASDFCLWVRKRFSLNPFYKLCPSMPCNTFFSLRHCASNWKIFWINFGEKITSQITTFIDHHGFIFVYPKRKGYKV